MSYKTPGVYIVEESGLFPPQIVGVATAVPAFLGYTALRPDSTTAPVIRRIDSLREYVHIFGGACRTRISVTVSDDKVTVDQCEQPTFKLYYAIAHYFMNGGGPCYIVSLGDHTSVPDRRHFENALEALSRESEPTLYVLTDLAALGQADIQTAVCSQALDACAALRNRFAILDVPHVTAGETRKGDVDAFRARLRSPDGFSYGAAYYPDLQTLLPIEFDDATVRVRIAAAAGVTETVTLDALRNKPDYDRVKAALATQRVILPPSAAVAGVYVAVDASRGVWKAPANVGIAGVVGPVVEVTSNEQDEFNVHDTGLSVNVIRSFVGQGTRVWGARTLDGNSSDWRYVPVRRLFLHVEESIRQSSRFVVFEPNDQSTWFKIKGMIESYLYGLWQNGALFGSTPETAYSVSVGLGKTMTQDDVLNGRLIVEVRLAAVRPAEFIVIRFSYKMLEA